MWSKIKALLVKWCVLGMHLPFAHDPVAGQPSVTLLFPYVTFILAIGSTIALHFNEKLFAASSLSILFWVIAVVFYRLRKLDKIKIDLDDKSIELEGSDDK